VSEPTHRYLSP